ncbi:MAG: FG-GAP-like repeat-containing protein [Planctomycetota bacterium]
MTALHALLVCASLAPQESHFIDASLPVEGTLLAAEFIDVDMDGRDEVVLAVRTPAGAREIRIHDAGPESVARTPKRTIRVLEDVVAWTFADVREEPGRELVLLTRGGAFAMDPNVERLRGNIRRLIDVPLLYDVPNPLALPYWAYVLETGRGERLLLPDRNGFALYGPPEVGPAGAGDAPGEDGAEGAWRRLTDWPAGGGAIAPDPDDDEARRRKMESDRRRGEARFADTVGSDLMPFMSESLGTTLASDGRSMRAPALVDIDGDGRRDLLLLLDKQLRVHIATAEGIPAIATRTEELPEYLKRGDQAASLRLVDLDGDGRLDLLATWSEDLKSFENVEWRVFVLLSKPGRMFPAEPNQVLRFEAAQIRLDVGLIDGDKRPDLVVRTFVLPGKIEAATGLKFEFSHLMYRGERGGFERKPTLRQARTYDESGVREVIANRRMTMDCSGDGLGDLVEVGLDGRIAIKRLRKESGFFSATKWLIDDAPWKSYAARGSVLSLEIEDLNGDGLGDIVSRGENGLTVLLSKKGKGNG